MLTTSFTELIGCKAPVQSAGLGGGDPALVEAVSNAGALGMLGAAQIPPEALGQILKGLRANVPEGKFGVNFLAPFLSLDNADDRACVEIAAQQADLVEFFFDTPNPEWVRRAHGGGTMVSWQVGSSDEARQAIDAGCDMIVAQGVEAGGHVRGTTPILALLEQIAALAAVPVLAAGGVAGGAGLAAALASGAAGVRIGTRFVTAVESSAHPRYVEALLRANAGDTVLTKAFGVGWPDAPHRILRSCLDAANEHNGETVGSILAGGVAMEVPKFFVGWPNSATTGNISAMCQYAGESVESVKEVQTAADIVREIVEEAEALLG